MKKLNMNFTDRQASKLKQVARETEVSQAELVRRAVDEYLAKMEEGMMAKPKCGTTVQELPNGIIHLWVNEPEKEIAGIKALEGVSFVLLIRNPIHVYIDPRYDTTEVADEIKLLLAAEFPSAFKDIE